MIELSQLQLFDAYGVELEYMIVDSRNLDVLPVADQLLLEAAGDYASEVDMGEISWSNELVRHVVELKTNGPSRSWKSLPRAFLENVRHINNLLAPLGGQLMPTAMHPWMKPSTEMQLWPHEYHTIYSAYHRIFNCRGHGWSNLQATHLNLPFAGDEQFGRLHAAIRLVLPILPALAASSPIVEGRVSGLLDTRLDMYRTNALRIPSITGQVIPEPVFTREEYEQRILSPMYRDISPYDAEGTLQHEFLNSRGAIARFERSSIEIRLLDVQECPAADIAICIAVTEVVRALTEQKWLTTAEQRCFDTARLANLLLNTLRDAEQAVINDREYLRHFGIPSSSCSAGQIWQQLCDALSLCDLFTPACRDALALILQRGPLGRRIEVCVGATPSLDDLRHVYAGLCDCLASGRMFQGC